MVCECGNVNNSAAQFCGGCGKAVRKPISEAATAVSAHPAARPSTRMSRVRVAALMVTVAVAATGYWWFTRPPGVYVTDNGGLFPIEVDGKHGFMNSSGETVVKPEFEEVGGFSEGLSGVKVGTKYGYIDTEGRLVITPQFDAAMPFRFGRAAVKLCCGPGFSSGGKNRFGFITTDGKYIGTPDLLWVSDRGFNGELTPVQAADGRVGFLNRSGELMHMGKVHSANSHGYSEGLAAAALDNRWGFVDPQGDWVINPQFEAVTGFSAGLAAVTVGGRVGYVDRAGRFAINPQYKSGDPFTDNLAVVRSPDDMSAVIDKAGTVVVPFGTYAHIGTFRDGLAPVLADGKYGFIDTKGTLALPAEYDYAEPFQNGLARVWALDKSGYITKAGAFVVNPFPGTTLKAERERIANEEKLAAERAEQERVSAEAARVAAEVKAAEERARLIAELPTRIVGNWRWSDSTTDYRADGSIHGVTNAGVKFVNSWRLSGETLTVRMVSRAGRPYNGEESFVVEAVDDTTLRVRGARDQIFSAVRIR